MNHERIRKLRALAERPGTPAEGEVARLLLDRELAKATQESEAEGVLRDYLSRNVPYSDLSDALRKYREDISKANTIRYRESWGIRDDDNRTYGANQFRTPPPNWKPNPKYTHQEKAPADQPVKTIRGMLITCVVCGGMYRSREGCEFCKR
jgi:hypothetical protein